MYLVDHKIKELLDSLEISTDRTAGDFDPSAQIGPCSIDLRLSGVYWKPTKRLLRDGLHLDRVALREIDSRRGWKRFEAEPGESFKLGPGEMVLARTAENFRVPADHAAALEGRSSYARLGLQVHAAGGFINPGWRGHMPLTIVNQSNGTLWVPVGMPVAQVMLVSLDGVPEADYSQRAGSKYQDDDGGPSFWWRDALVNRLSQSDQMTGRVLDEIDSLLTDRSVENMLGRLDEFLSKNSTTEYQSGSGILEDFAEAERKTKTLNSVVHFAALWAWTVVIAAIAIPAALDRNWLWAVWASAVVASAVAVVWHFWADEDEDYLTTSDLDRLKESRRRAGIEKLQP